MNRENLSGYVDFMWISLWPLWALVFGLIGASGCGGIVQPPDHAIMPSMYIDGLPVKRIQEGEDVFVNPDAILIDETRHVWLKGDAPRIKDPDPTDRFIKVFKHGDEYVIITCNIKSFSISHKSNFEGRDAAERFRVAKIFVKTNVNDLASLKLPDKESQVQITVNGQVVARRGL